MAISTRSGKVLSGPSVGKPVIDDVVELDEEAEDEHPVEFEKLDNDDIPSNHQETDELEKDKGKKGETVVQLTLNGPLVEALEQIPGYAKFMKDLITKKKTVSYELVDNLHHCNAISTRSLVQKKANPGAFTIPCTIRSLDFTKALCDLGVTNFIFPTDFVILDCEVDFEVGIILGRSFLTTGSVLNDLWANELQFRLNDEVVQFYICQSMKQHKKMSVFSIIDVYYEDKREVPIEEKFVVETLVAVLMNFDSEGIEEYEETICSLMGKGSYSYALNKLNLNLKKRPTPPAKPSIEEPPVFELKELPGHLWYMFLGSGNTFL
ncbi:uncharacterized protein LOC124889571 [Capsicum annuum]|uniref:uncharacterized protein LOC124889571 n=1 Tax=Capsicum annuum TaxID=4072 RepID=UPI001FB1055B|nr:uncharacterized protein LOC124889571 [Capsicum annuum]